MVIIQIRAGRLRLTLEIIDRRKPAKRSDRNKKTARDAVTSQAVHVEVRNVVTKD